MPNGQKVWDHWPTDEELVALVVDPVDQKDQHGHDYSPLTHSQRITAICTACEKDFGEGGWVGFAPQGHELYRILLCPDHTMVRSLMDAEEEVMA